MVKTLLVTSVLVLALASVTGCVGGNSSANNSTPVTTATVVVSAKESTVVTAPTVVPSTATTAAKTPTPTAKAATPTVVSNTSGDALLNKMKNIKAFTANFTINNDGEETKGKMTYSGSNVRMDVVQNGETLVFLIDGNQKTSYIYNAKEKKALYMPYDQGKTGETPGDLLGWDTNSTVPPKVLGQETVDGKACTIYEITTATSKSKVWVDKANGFPIKYDAVEDGITNSTHFTNIKISSVDEKLFVLPEGTEILDMSELMAPTATPGAKAATPIVSSTPIGGLLPAAITGPVPLELKDNVQIPSGLTLVRDSGQAEENLNTRVWKATAQWTGSVMPMKIADFYKDFLAGGWKYKGGVVSDLRVDVDYAKSGTDPEVTLNVVAVSDKKVTTLTLTIANGDTNYYP